MHYRSLLFPGLLITAIASLLIVQSCSKNEQTSTENNLELDHASGQALSSLIGCYNTTGGRLAPHPACDEYEKYLSVIVKHCKSNNKDACDTALKLQKARSSMIIQRQIDGMIGN